MKKVILISIDGLRSDALAASGHPFVAELEKISSHTYNSRSVIPPVTLPAHVSMMNSVIPERHGILTNTYVPQVRPVKGIFEKISEAGGISAMFYGWDPLRDVASPYSLKFASFIESHTSESVDTLLTDEAIKCLDTYDPDFTFLYLVDTDDKGGHDNGWMSDEYLRRVRIALDNSKRIVEKYAKDHTVIITADHGGHSFGHGADIPEDMIIPLFCIGEKFPAGTIIDSASILDIAPTIARLMGIEPEREWQGKSLA